VNCKHSKQQQKQKQIKTHDFFPQLSPNHPSKQINIQTFFPPTQIKVIKGTNSYIKTSNSEKEKHPHKSHNPKNVNLKMINKK
jgi:hypothetical protein